MPRWWKPPTIRPPREKTGSTDFGNVMYDVPGSCIRMAFVPEGTSSHSREYLEAGKSRTAHRSVLLGAKILAASCLDMICDAGLLEQVKGILRRRRSRWDGKIIET